MLDKKLLSYVERAMRGDREAFSLICRYKGRDILYICMGILGDNKDGEDAAQEVMAYLYHKIGELRAPASFNVWLYKVTTNICINIKRKKYMKHETTASQGNPVSEEMLEERMDFLPAAYLRDKSKKKILAGIVRELPFQCMIAVMMFYFDGLSYKEMGEVLGLEKEELANTLRKSKRLIRQEIDRIEGGSAVTVREAASAAVLGGIIREDILRMVSDSQVSVLQEAFDQLIGVPMQASGSGKRGRNPGNKVKNIVITTAAAGICITIAGGIWNYYLQDQTVSSEPMDENMIPQDISITNGEEEVFDINTLEDMIEDEPADQLRHYVHEGGSMTEVRAFLEQLGMEENGSVYRLNPEQEDSLYLLEKQDKLLMVITRHTSGQEEMELVYEFTAQGAYVPEDVTIAIYYERWREAL